MCSQLSGDVWVSQSSGGGFSVVRRLRNGVGDVGGVPERDCGDDEVEAGGAKLLRLAAAVGDPALLEGADVAGQTMRLTETGAIKVFSDIRSGKTMERPGLEVLLAYARKGDTLSVVRLDRLGRSLGELLTTVAMLKERGIALLSLEERIDTNSAAGELVCWSACGPGLSN
jgi:Resolvase, N terminal domain